MEVYVDSRIHSIKDVSFFQNDVDGVDLDKLQVQLSGGRFFVDDVSKILTFEVTIKFLVLSSNDELTLLLEYINQVGFYVENIDEIVHNEGDSPLIDKGIVKFFLEIILHTNRGILSAKTRGTNLERAYLPIYKAEDLIK